MRLMVIETFKNGEAEPVYRRFFEKGRMMPEGLYYLDSWISEDLSTCWQVMQTDDLAKVQTWMDAWSDLVDFQLIPVLTSTEARARTGF